MPITLAGATALSAGASALAAGGQMAVSGKYNRRSAKIAKDTLKQNQKQFEDTIAYNERAAELNRQFMESYYNKYESPAAMMRQYKEAGINPYLYSGGANSQIASSMGNAPEMDSSGMMSANTDFANNMAAINGQRAGQMTEVIQNGFNSAISAYNAYLDAESKAKDIEAKDIENQRNRFDLQSFFRPVEDTDLQHLIGFGRNSDFVKNFESRYGRKMTYGDMFAYTKYLSPMHEFNQKYGFERQPSNIFHQMYNAAQAYKNSLTFEHFNNESAIFGQGLHARDITRGSLMNPKTGRYNTVTADAEGRRNIDTQKLQEFLFDLYAAQNGYEVNNARFQSWHNDYKQRLLQLGINPNGTGWFDSVGQIMFGNGDYSDAVIKEFRQRVADFTNNLLQLTGSVVGGVNSAIDWMFK